MNKVIQYKDQNRNLSTLAIDENMVELFRRSIAIDDNWFNSFSVPKTDHKIKRVIVDETVYFLSENAINDTRIMVMKIDIFSAVPKPRDAFDRLLFAALAQFGRIANVPNNWRPFYDRSLLSFYAQPRGRGNDHRLCIDSNPGGTRNIYAYAMTEGPVQFENIQYNEQPFDVAYLNYENALKADNEQHVDENAIGVTFSEPIGFQHANGATLEDWYNRILTDEQRRFVDRDHSAPVRLKGAAGTGKTISLAVKCLRDAYNFEEKIKKTKTYRHAKIAFLTHSSALAHDVVLSIFYALDPSARWKELENASIWFGSIYELAQERLKYKFDDIEPLSTDGREGRELQFEMIDSVIDQCLEDESSEINSLGLSSRLRDNLFRRERRSWIIASIMNEFACVIDAEGIRRGTAAGDNYLLAERENWQMELSNREERGVLLEIHDKYCKELQEYNVLSVDQMIADFNRYLLSHEWNLLRSEEGFDLIFVDELHYFNRAERMVFHNLFKPSAANEGKYPLFLAYDLKQSPTDAFLSSDVRDAAGMFRSLRAGGTELVELTKVFRSTPQIAGFLEDLDGSFPALDLGGEWGDYEADSDQESGNTPELRVYRRNIDLLDDVFKAAAREANLNGGKNVAVLCLNDRLFSTYLKVGRIEGKYLAITGRDQVGQLKNVGNRCIFSMPEYVAGLQFECVYLIHLDEAETSGETNTGVIRRFISRCYLGASRSSKKLFVASSRERGGPSNILKIAVQSNTLNDIDDFFDVSR